MIDLHMHTVFSDGELIPSELVRRAQVAGYKAVGITDHADLSNFEHIIANVGRFAREHGHFFDVTVLTGLEITHVPPSLIPDMTAKPARPGRSMWWFTARPWWSRWRRAPTLPP